MDLLDDIIQQLLLRHRPQPNSSDTTGNVMDDEVIAWLEEHHPEQPAILDPATDEYMNSSGETK